MSERTKYLLTVAAITAFLLLAFAARAHDRDHSHDGWYAALRQPDNPSASCCGVADAYWCDEISTDKGRAYCAITDDQDVPGRPKLPLGTKIEIPDSKLKWGENDPQTARGDVSRNPTGHSIVFLSSGGAVYCFVLGGGV